MRQLITALLLFCLFAGGCRSGDELTREDAFRLLQQSNVYPKVVDYDLYTSDPQEAKKVIDAGLDREGLVTVQQMQRLADAGKPLISFTPKANSSLLPTPEKEKAVRVQKIKLAEEELKEVTKLTKSDDGQKVDAEYTTAYKNVSGFAPLTSVNFQQYNTHNVTFVHSDDGWHLAKSRQP